MSGLPQVRDDGSPDLLCQWDRLMEKERVRRISILPVVLKKETLEHGHQGIEWTIELVRQHCHPPGMSSDIKQWLGQECNRCQVAKDSGPGPVIWVSCV